MSNERNNIDELFRGKLGDYSVEAPEHVWTAIEARRTPLYRAISYFKSKRGAALSALLLLLTVSSIAYISNMGNTTQQSTATTQAIQKPTLDSAPVQAAKMNSTYTNANNNTQNSPSATTGTTVNSTISEANTETNTTPSSSKNVDAITPKTNSNGGGTTTPDNTKLVKGNTTPLPATNEKGDNDNNTNNGEVVETGTTQSNNNTTTLPETTEGDKPEVDAKAEANNPTVEDTDEAEKANKQNKTTIVPDGKRSKFSVGLYGGVNLVGRSLEANGVNNDYFEAKRQAENFTLGYTIGARLNYELNNFATLRGGLQYTSFGERINFERDYNYTTIDTSTGVILDPATQQPIGTVTRIDTNEHTETARANTTNTISFIDIPVQVEWTVFKTQKFSLFATTGASLNLRFTQKGHQLNQRLTGLDEISSANNPYKTNAGVSILAGMGIEYGLCPNNKCSILFETTYRHGINNVMKSNAGMNQTFKMFTGSVGLRYRF